MYQRTFLVTGASRGIGRALSNRLAKDGHKVVGLARNANVPNFPGTIVSADLGDRESTCKAIDALLARFRFDGIVNNVGAVKPQAIGSMVLDDLDDVLRLNLHPAVFVTQALLPGMKLNRWGRIINISSLAILGMAERAAYAAAKAALVSFTRCWALELAQDSITVNAVAPGPTETDLFRANNPIGSEAERLYLARIPLGRFGKPDEIAAASAFLMSEDAGFITGQTIFIDGGASIGRSSV